MRDIVRIWKSGQSSSTLVIPKKIAKETGIVPPSHVTIETIQDGGILIKKLEV